MSDLLDIKLQIFMVIGYTLKRGALMKMGFLKINNNQRKDMLLQYITCDTNFYFKT